MLLFELQRLHWSEVCISLCRSLRTVVQMRSTTAEKAIGSQFVMLNTRPTAASGAPLQRGHAAREQSRMGQGLMRDDVEGIARQGSGDPVGPTEAKERSRGEGREHYKHSDR